MCEQDIIDTYKELQSVRLVSEKFKIKDWRINAVLKKNNIKKHKGNQKYRIKEDYFEKIDTHEKAYFLGFLWADGHNERKSVKNHFRCDTKITLNVKDISILEYFRDLIFIDKKPVRTKTRFKPTGLVRGKSVFGVLSLRNRKVSDDLFTLGMIPNKTPVSHIPNILEELMPSFMLGYFDGDGSSYIQKHNRRGKTSSMCCFVDIVSNKTIIDEMVNYFNKVINVPFFTKLCNGNPNYLHMYICSYDSVKKFYDYIYQHQKVYLQRKRDKFLEYFNYKENHKYGEEI